MQPRACPAQAGCQDPPGATGQRSGPLGRGVSAICRSPELPPQSISHLRPQEGPADGVWHFGGEV